MREAANKAQLIKMKLHFQRLRKIQNPSQRQEETLYDSSAVGTLTMDSTHTQNAQSFTTPDKNICFCKTAGHLNMSIYWLSLCLLELPKAA